MVISLKPTGPRWHIIINEKNYFASILNILNFQMDEKQQLVIYFKSLNPLIKGSSSKQESKFAVILTEHEKEIKQNRMGGMNKELSPVFVTSFSQLKGQWGIF